MVLDIREKKKALNANFSELNSNLFWVVAIQKTFYSL